MDQRTTPHASDSPTIAAAFTAMAAMAGAALVRPVAVIAGPTCAGKSSVALALCGRRRGELVSADSVQVYRRLEIGANKPSAAERQRVPHHLVDVREPREAYSTADWVAAAAAAVADVHARGGEAVVCGGTPLYVQWLVNGAPDAPRPDPAAEAAALAAVEGWRAAGDYEGGRAQLAALAPARAAKLGRNDWYRLERSLALAMGGGGDAAFTGRRKKVCHADLRPVFLAPPRLPLYRRIDERCEAMIAQGLLREVAGLVAAGDMRPPEDGGGAGDEGAGEAAAATPAARAIGYRQCLAYLCRDAAAAADAEAFLAFVDTFCAATRNYAAQQYKWFRKEPGVVVMRPEASPAETVDAIEALLALSRADFDARTSGPQQQAVLDAIAEDAKGMKTFASRRTLFLPGSAALAAALAEADAQTAAVRAALQGVL